MQNFSVTLQWLGDPSTDGHDYLIDNEWECTPIASNLKCNHFLIES